MTRSPIELSVDSSKVNKKACIKENVLYIFTFKPLMLESLLQEKGLKKYVTLMCHFTFAIYHLTKIMDVSFYTPYLKAQLGFKTGIKYTGQFS